MRVSQELRHGLAVLAIGLALALAGCNGNPGNTPSTGSTSVPAATESTGVGGDTAPSPAATESTGVGGNTAPVTSTEALTDTNGVTSTDTLTNTTSP
jgi:hypothetical protein